MGRDGSSATPPHTPVDFNPLSPHGERLDSSRSREKERCNFNPLSPHGERPNATVVSVRAWSNFNPLSPHGERRRSVPAWLSLRGFQSTLPAWGETSTATRRSMSTTYFNPLSPHGERRHEMMSAAAAAAISIHSPRMGRDSEAGSPLPFPRSISIHSPRMGRDNLPRW